MKTIPLEITADLSFKDWSKKAEWKILGPTASNTGKAEESFNADKKAYLRDQLRRKITGHLVKASVFNAWDKRFVRKYAEDDGYDFMSLFEIESLATRELFLLRKKIVTIGSREEYEKDRNTPATILVSRSLPFGKGMLLHYSAEEICKPNNKEYPDFFWAFVKREPEHADIFRMPMGTKTIPRPSEKEDNQGSGPSVIQMQK